MSGHSGTSDSPVQPQLIRGRHIFWATVLGVVVLVGASVCLWLLMRDEPSFSYFDVARTAVIGVAAIGAVPAAYVAYRRQRTLEMQRRDDVESAVRAVDEEFQDRYVDAATQLGSERAATRMAGIYAMAQLADEWGAARGREFAQLCVDVLCAYLRLPYVPSSDRSDPAAAEYEVRRTLIRLIRDRLRPAVEGGPWSDLSIALQNVQFDFCDFSDARFGGKFVSFAGANFAGASTFQNAVFDTRAYFNDVVVSSGVLTFEGAELSAGERRYMRFSGGKVQNGARVVCGPQLAKNDRIDWGDLTPEDAGPHRPSKPSSGGACG